MDNKEQKSRSSVLQKNLARQIYDSTQEMPFKVGPHSRNNFLNSFDDQSFEQKF